MREDYTPYFCRLTPGWASSVAFFRQRPALRICLLVACCLFAGLLEPSSLRGQHLFKKLESADKYFTQRIAHFPAGDLLIGNSSIEAVRTGEGGEIYLTRMDPCGNIEWSKTYRREQEYLELKDLLISESGQIYAYGSAYIGLDELLFFLKLDARGNIQQFKLYEPETVDHFTYNIDLRGDQLMAYGLILDFNTKKFGFIAVFDEALNFKWGKKFSPFSSSGNAQITADRGFICRSGQFLYKLDATGALEWATVLGPNEQNSPVSGPLEVTDGYILEATGNGLSFFYKLDLSGKLVWKSDQFPSKAYPADMKFLADGEISVVYSAATDNDQQLCRLILTPDGRIRKQEQLSTETSIKPGRVFHSFQSPEGTLAISGNPDATIPQPVDAASFLLVSSPTGPTDECFGWSSLQTVQPNQVPMSFSPLDTAILSTRFTFANNTNITPSPFAIPLSNACAEVPGPELVRIDTFLECGEHWTVALPAPDFNWEDEPTAANPRKISEAGTYLAKNEDCGNQVIYEYTLKKPDCICPVYLPTAFSPNQDGRNDLLELYSACEMTRLQMAVFDRWGAKVFESKVPGVFWDGRVRGEPAPGGLYLVKVDYEWLEVNGNIQSGSLTQEVTLIR